MKPTGFGDPRAGAAGEAGLGGMAAVSSYFYLPWYSVAWQHRALITIPRGVVSTDLTSFPVYVNGTGMPASLWTAAQADGDDLLITAEDGVTKLAHDLPHFVPGSTTMEAHFLAPTLYALHDNRFWLYWGNAAAADQRNAAGVWADYLAVWHAGEALAANWADSTGNGWTGTNSIAPGAKSGKLYPTGGDTLDGTDDGVSIAGAFTAEFGGSPTVVCSMWLKRTATGDRDTLFNLNLLTTNSKVLVEYRADSTIRVGGRSVSTDGFQSVSSLDAYTDTASWHHIVAVLNVATNEITIYRDGVAVATGGTPVFGQATFSAETGDPGMLGAGGSVTSNPFAGLIDEARVTLTPPSLAWVATEFANQSSPTTFYTVGPATGRIVQALLTDTAGNGLDQGWML